jgi:hypothetical protein
MQMADTAVQLARLSFPKIGRIYQTAEDQFDVGPFVQPNGVEYGPFATAIEYYTFLASRDRVERNARTNGELNQTAQSRDRFASYLYYTAAARLSLANEGPFSISHGDYGVHNILFDDDYKMTGVVDWDSSHTAPALTCGDWPALTHVRWPYVDDYYPGVLESLLKRRSLFHEVIKLAEQGKPIVHFEGKLMSDIVGSDPALVAQILEVLCCDRSYEEYDGKKVFQFLYGESSFKAAKTNFERYGDIVQ